MRVLLKNFRELLDDSISLECRGLFLTIVFLKDDDSKITLAKVKAKVSFRKNKENLMLLHEKGFIDWSGYKLAKKTVEENKLNPSVVEIMDFMNGLYKTYFNYTSASHYNSLLALLKKYSIEDIKRVVANRFDVWKDDSFMSKYLTPSTIFRPSKFPKYLEEANMTRKGERFLQSKKMGLKDGDLINVDNCDDLMDDETYLLEIDYLDRDEKCISTEKIYKFGKDIKRSLKIQVRTIDFGGWLEFIYKYKAE